MHLYRVYIISILIFFFTPVFAQDRATQIKAVFLFKFTDYISWPENKKNEDFNLCIWGDHPFNRTLDLIAQKQTGRDYNITYYPRGTLPRQCHLIYTDRFDHRLNSLNNTLVVSDQQNFSRDGGMIEMANHNGKIKLIVNLDAANNAGLKISSRLLKIADVRR